MQDGQKNQNAIFQLSVLYIVTSINVEHVADYVSSCVLRLANNTICNSKFTNLSSYSVSLFYNLYRLVTLYKILLYQLHKLDHNYLLELEKQWEIFSIAYTDYHQEKDHFLWVSTLSDQLWIESEFSSNYKILPLIYCKIVKLSFQ